MIRAIFLDIDGVLTDGKMYIDGHGNVFKSLNYKDLDAITSFKQEGIIIGCISGEDTAFSQNLRKYVDFAELGCKCKKEFIENYCKKNNVDIDDILYVGDGKYDIDALKAVGMSVCPSDAIRVVQDIVDVVLETKGGSGCVSELYYYLQKQECLNDYT